MNIEQAIRVTCEQLSSVTETARLEAELLVALVMAKTRTQLYACMREPFSDKLQDALTELIKQRIAGKPLAYIRQEQEFWSLSFKVTAATLIPRPETECLVEWVLQKYAADTSLRVADLGTGSGAIAVALAHERPAWRIDATDLSADALVIAKHNASKHAVSSINFYQGSWCEPLPDSLYDLIISNPPYISVDDIHLQQLGYEPQTALVAANSGLSAIELIAKQAGNYLQAGATLVLEHGYQQALQVEEILQCYKFDSIHLHYDLAGRPRFTSAQWR